MKRMSLLFLFALLLTIGQGCAALPANPGTAAPPASAGGAAHPPGAAIASAHALALTVTNQSPEAPLFTSGASANAAENQTAAYTAANTPGSRTERP